MIPSADTASGYDWQFWVATAVCAAAFVWLVRYLWRIVRPPRGKRTRATLTIGGREIE
jgi:hypothetical protein